MTEEIQKDRVFGNIPIVKKMDMAKTQSGKKSNILDVKGIHQWRKPSYFQRNPARNDAGDTERPSFRQ